MVPNTFSLAGKVAVIAGTGRDWLGALASYLAEAGADVALAAQDEKKMAAATQEIEKRGRQALAIPTDVANYQSIEEMVAKVIARWGKIDILVNNMDLQFAKPFLDVTEAEWQRVIAANLTAVFLCTKTVGKTMVEKQKGSIITLSSVLAERGLRNGAAYCASKGGVGQLTRVLALEWARENIRVNVIGVGWDSNLAGGGLEEGFSERYISVRRFCQPEDIGALLVFLASDAASYATGQTYFVSGGVMAHG